MKTFIGGEWRDKPEKIEVLNPFDGSLVDTVPVSYTHLTLPPTPNV